MLETNKLLRRCNRTKFTTLTQILHLHYCCLDIDECADVVCANDGVCVDQVNGYECQCKVGFTGTDCQTGKQKFIINLQLDFIHLALVLD